MVYHSIPDKTYPERMTNPVYVIHQITEVIYQPDHLLIDFVIADTLDVLLHINRTWRYDRTLLISLGNKSENKILYKGQPFLFETIDGHVYIHSRPSLEPRDILE